jgi:hypothetical protein
MGEDIRKYNTITETTIATNLSTISAVSFFLEDPSSPNLL